MRNGTRERADQLRRKLARWEEIPGGGAVTGSEVASFMNVEEATTKRLTA
jgi:hypothetical protein